jgi:hypothetical protein
LTGKLQHVGGSVKNFKIRIVAVALAAAFTLGAFFVPAALSQSASMTVEIPFAFYAGGMLMPAGQYHVKPDSFGSSVIHISDGKGNVVSFMTIPAKNKESMVGRLVFSRYGLESFLSELDWPGHDMGHAVIKTDLERELIASNSNSRARVILAAK